MLHNAKYYDTIEMLRNLCVREVEPLLNNRQSFTEANK